MLAVLSKLIVAVALGAAPPPATIIRATQPGMRTLDQGEGGGNPFASAFIEGLGRAELDLAGFTALLRERTRALSDGFQEADVPAGAAAPLSLGRPAPDERRIAMVLVVADYRLGMAPLAGAAHDAGRVAAALERAGFETRLVLDPAHAELPAILGRFAADSAAADVALIYSTGHGIEVDGRGYLLHGDFPRILGLTALDAHAEPLTRIAASMQARSRNLLFFAGCRDNPFG